MKLIKYHLATETNHGTPDEPHIELTLSAVTLGWSRANEELAQREAYLGEYTIEDDGEPETTTPQQDTDALLVDHEYRLTLLELGLSE